MEAGIVGLGKMGANMALRLLRDGHRVVATDLDAEARRGLSEQGATVTEDIHALVGATRPPRTVWLMLPAGNVTESVINEILPLLQPGDVLVDAGNSYWKDSMRRGAKADALGVRFADCGVSGGVWGLESGFNLMLGCSLEVLDSLRPALESLAGGSGYLRVGPVGSGHFVKMVHNGIEYAMLEAYGEGFEALASFPHADIDLEATAALWQDGSVIRSWLLELARLALTRDPRLENVKGYVEDSGMGRWTVDYAVEQAIPLPAITAALFARFASRQEDSFAARLAAALRKEFGGHAVVEKEL
jgi:6-phosphogluconate dehydrogenase